MGRNMLMGCGAITLLGFAGIVLVVVIAVFATGPAEESTGGTATKGDEAQELAEEEAVVGAIGDTVEVGEVAWRVTGAENTDVLTAEFTEEQATGNFVVVDLEFTYNSDERKFLDSGNMSLIDSEGRKSEPDTGTFRYVPDELDIFIDSINPGVVQQGRVIFTVADGAEEFTFHGGNLEFFSDETAQVGLGF